MILEKNKKTVTRFPEPYLYFRGRKAGEGSNISCGLDFSYFIKVTKSKKVADIYEVNLLSPEKGVRGFKRYIDF